MRPLRILFTLLYSCCSIAAIGQISGTVQIPSAAYPDLATVINALNTSGVGNGGVTIRLAPGNPQLAPAGGYRLGSLQLNGLADSTRPITISGNGNVITAPAGTGYLDGVFTIIGTDYVTIDSLHIVENPANTTATTRMEWGYACLKADHSIAVDGYYADGCHNVTIRHCTVTLSKLNRCSGIYLANHKVTDSSILNVYSFEGVHHHNQITGNVIQNCHTGIYLATHSLNTTWYDHENVIGGASSEAGNLIRNFTAQGIYSYFERDLNVSNNTIVHYRDGYGINAYNLNGMTTDHNYFLSVDSGALYRTGSYYAIREEIYLNSGISAHRNNIFTSANAGFNTYYGVWTRGGYLIDISGNQFRNMHFAALSRATLISSINGKAQIRRNEIAGDAIPYLQSPGGDITFISATSNDSIFIRKNAASQVLLGGNSTFTGIAAAGTPPAYYNINLGIEADSNLIDYITCPAGFVKGMTVSSVLSAKVHHNTVRNISADNTYGIVIERGNRDTLIRQWDIRAYGNLIHNIVIMTLAGNVRGIYVNDSGAYLYNNMITDVSGDNKGMTVYGIYAGYKKQFLSNNTIRIAGVSGGSANFTVAGVYADSALILKNNIVYVAAAPLGNGIVACILRRPAGNGPGTAPPADLFEGGNNIYYVPPGPQQYIYAEGNDATDVHNGYGIGGLTVNATAHIYNDPGFNNRCSTYKTFMNASGEASSYYEDNLAGRAVAGYYAPAGASYAFANGITMLQPAFTDDISGAVRLQPWSSGALQFTGTRPAGAPPAISYGAIAGGPLCAHLPVLQAMIYANAATQVNTTTDPPRLYYKKATEANLFGNYPADNTGAFNGWKYVSASGTAPAFTFNLDYTKLTAPLAAGDSVIYFVAAQDNSSTPAVGIDRAVFTNVFCPSGVNIPPAAGGVRSVPGLNGFRITAQPGLTFSSPQRMCIGSVLRLYATAPRNIYSNYVWSPSNGLYTDPGATIAYTPGSNRDTVYIKAASAAPLNYTVIATNPQNNCSLSQAVSIVPYPVPQPVVSVFPGYVATGYYHYYHWMLDGAEVSTDSISRIFRPQQTGDYSVIVTDSNGCIGESAKVRFTAPNVQVAAAGAQIPVLVYPNPAGEVVYLKSPVPVQAVLTSMEGRIILSETGASSLNIRHLASGMYLLRIMDQRGLLIKTEKLIKSR